MENQEAEEIFLINLFKQVWPDFPNGKLVKSESPDFILRCNRKNSIGIELTRIDNHYDFIRYKARYKKEDSDTSTGKSRTNFSITREQIESTIQRKEEKLSLYRTKLSDAYWLIITADLTGLQQKSRIPQNIGLWQFDTTFNKLFLLFLPEGKLFEFK